ncbi:MAG: hypothetical protein [Caudoviricetes sp.]|nr:MAG: hypothetical protein [Caudoviricetes sp.]
MKLRLGMRVRVTENQEDYEVKGLVGTIVKMYYNDDFYGLEFNSNEFDDGHCLDGTLPHGSQHGLWVSTDRLKPFNIVLENK